ncbi:hypothetical protein [Labrys monachus]|uniref:Uncharacterized protein n=1 Tax=Labrys monachus TaxID=217067 RepID=A0ABU0FC61_9HYPH|nr:hypothetical protein [Labrys monachus]MDQ0392202.1 hypothetical protein [Labrys monachus]
MTHKDEDGDHAAEIMRQRMRQETKDHLRDIRREHGIGRHWASLVLPAGTPHVLTIQPLHSCAGSPGAMCAANGDAVRRIAASD